MESIGVRWRIAFGLAASAVVVILGGWLAAGRAFAAGDANEARCPVATESSPGFRASLPDCRAYEIVSEANSGDTLNVIGSYGFPDGSHVYYNAFLPTPGEGARGGMHERFLATRRSWGWEQRAVSLPQGKGPLLINAGVNTDAEGVVFTRGFSEALLMSPFQDPFEDPRLDEAIGVAVYGLSLESGAVSTVSLPDSGAVTQSMIEPPGSQEGCEIVGCGEFLAGGSADGSRAFFVTSAKLTTAPGSAVDTHEFGNEIYERTQGHTYLVGVLPDGSVPNCGAELAQSVRELYSYGAVAPSGANVVFDASDCSVGGLYLRDVVNDTTVQLPGSRYGGRAGAGPGEEEKIFTFGEGKIYEYHVESRQTTKIGEGGLLAYSADGSRVYFLGPNEAIYVYHEGEETKVVPGTLAGGYGAGPLGESGGLIASGSATDYGQTRDMPVASGGGSDGSHFLFIDTAELTGYHNKGHQEAYVYNAETGNVTCISCNPSGKPPPPEPEPVQRNNAQLITKFMMDVGEGPFQSPSPPFISDDGSRAVFETTEALAPQDENGTADVYEWSRVGANGCSEGSASYSPWIEGCVYLLSSGVGKEVPNNEGLIDGTHLVGASENLNDVYMQTSESLLPGLDNASKLYDVRVDGGFPYAPSPRGCEAGRCRTTAGEFAASGELTTEAFAGPGDVKSPITRGSKRPRARARTLARALKACRRRKEKRRRVACERRARRRLGVGANRRSSREGGSK